MQYFIDLTADEELSDSETPMSPIPLDSPEPNVTDSESDTSYGTYDDLCDEIRVARRQVQDDIPMVRGRVLPEMTPERIKYDICMDELKHPEFYQHMKNMIGGEFQYIMVKQLFCYGSNGGCYRVFIENKEM